MSVIQYVLPQLQIQKMVKLWKLTVSNKHKFNIACLDKDIFYYNLAPFID